MATINDDTHRRLRGRRAHGIFVALDSFSLRPLRTKLHAHYARCCIRPVLSYESRGLALPETYHFSRDRAVKASRSRTADYFPPAGKNRKTEITPYCYSSAALRSS